jgi:hypothetical protein
VGTLEEGGALVWQGFSFEAQNGNSVFEPEASERAQTRQTWLKCYKMQLVLGAAGSERCCESWLWTAIVNLRGQSSIGFDCWM